MRKAASFSSPCGPLSQTLCYNREPAWMGQCEGHSPAPVLGPSVPGAGSGPWGHGAGGAPSPKAVSAPWHCWLKGPEPKGLETAVHRGEGAHAHLILRCPKKRCFLQVMGFPYQRARSDVVLGVPARKIWLCPERSPSAPSPPARRAPWELHLSISRGFQEIRPSSTKLLSAAVGPWGDPPGAAWMLRRSRGTAVTAP